MHAAPISHVSLSDKTYDLLKEMIVRWQLQPGQRLIDDEIGEIEARLAEAQTLLEAGDLEKFYALDVETHRMIIDKGRNNYTKKVYANLATILRMIIRSDFNKHPKISEALQEHWAIFEAWKRHDVKAAKAALERHLARAEERVMENFVKNMSVPIREVV